jgi:hypothetical protein
MRICVGGLDIAATLEFEVMKRGRVWDSTRPMLFDLI